MNIVIQGASLAGLSAAVALSNKGYKVHVVEQHDVSHFDGFGICLYWNAQQCLDELGVLDKVKDSAYIMEGKTHWYNYNSELLGTVDYGQGSTDYDPYIGVSRSRIKYQLFTKCLKNGVRIYLGDSCFVSSEMKYQTSMTIKTRRGVTINDVGLFVAADGVNSAVRKVIAPDVEAYHSGFSLWRIVYPRHDKVTDKITVVSPNKRMGMIPFADDLMYLWAAIKTEPGRELCLHYFTGLFSDHIGWIFPLVAEASTRKLWHYGDVGEVKFTGDWHRGRFVFIGDAAHASTPFLAQGGSLALDDGLTLAQCLVNNSTVDEALVNFSERQKPVAELVQDSSKVVGNNYDTETVNLKDVQANINRFYQSLEAVW